MVYNLTTPVDRERIGVRIQHLLDKGAVVELTERTFRSPGQNRYLHLLIGVVAMETGNTLEDAKRWYYKTICNPDIFCIQRRDRLGNSIDTLRSSAELTQEEMSMSIDRFKRWGAENGIYMPNPGDADLLKWIEIEIDRNRAFLGH